VGCRASRFDRSCLSASAWCGSRSSAPRARTHPDSRVPGRLAGGGSGVSFATSRARACVFLHALAPAYRRRPPVSVSSLTPLQLRPVLVGLEPGEPSVHRAVLCSAAAAWRATATRQQPTRDPFVRSFVRTTGDLMAQEEIKVLHVGVAGLASFVVSSATSLPVPGSPAAAALRFAPAGAAPTHAAGTFVL
jgi:hypothetical protein